MQELVMFREIFGLIINEIERLNKDNGDITKLFAKEEDLEERVNTLEEKCAELMYELKLKEMKKRVKKND